MTAKLEEIYSTSTNYNGLDFLKLVSQYTQVILSEPRLLEQLGLPASMPILFEASMLEEVPLCWHTALMTDLYLNSANHQFTDDIEATSFDCLRSDFGVILNYLTPEEVNSYRSYPSIVGKTMADIKDAFYDLHNYIDKKLSVNLVVPSQESDIHIGDFTIHNAYRVTYRNKEIDMTPQVRRVASTIMQAIKGRRLSSLAVADRAGLAGVHNVKDNVSKARKAFRNVTGEQNKKFFHSDRNIGYWFDPSK